MKNIDEDMKWRMRILSSYGGKAIMTEDEIGDRLGFEEAFAIGRDSNTAWFVKGGESGILRFRNGIAAALGFERLAGIVSKVMYGTRYFVFA